MPNYTKLFSSIVTSTIWTEPHEVRIVWITLLATSDQNGEIHASIPGLARLSGVTIDECEAALEVLTSPDKYSRTPEHEGRRIAPIPGGWELLNHEKYRKLASAEDRREAAAERQRRKRERETPSEPGDEPSDGKDGESDPPSDTGSQESPPDVTQSVTPPRDSHASVTPSDDIAEAEAETEANTEADSKTPPPPQQRRRERREWEPEIRKLRPEWNFELSEDERKAGEPFSAILEAITPTEWRLMREFLHARLPKGANYWQPFKRWKFISTFGEVMESFLRWNRKKNDSAAARSTEKKPSSGPVELDPEAAEVLAQMMKDIKGRKGGSDE